MSEEAKAVQEVAKATGKGIDATRAAGRFMAKFIEPSMEHLSAIVSDRLALYRLDNRLRLEARLNEMLSAAGHRVPTKGVPLKLALPLLEAACMEDESSLQDRWATLLVNASNADSGVNLHRSHIAILEQLTAQQAETLDLIYDLPFEDSKNNGVLTVNLPDSACIAPKDDQGSLQPPKGVILDLSNLKRLGCITSGLTWGGGESYRLVNPTVLGQDFVMACRLKTRDTSA